jgi:DDE superfamily endonuclease
LAHKKAGHEHNRARKGNTPVVKATGARYGLNILSAVNAPEHFRFTTVEGGVGAGVFRERLKRRITGIDRKIYLIVDWNPAHRAKIVTNFVRENAHAVELFILPLMYRNSNLTDWLGGTSSHELPRLRRKARSS